MNDWSYLGSEWSYLGLPPANRVGYAYTKNLRLLRSAIDSALPDQSQLANPGKKIFKVSWNLTTEELNIATLYLLEHGYDWFEIELISEKGLVLHEVRLIEKFETVPISGQYYKLTATAETRIDPIACTPIICDVIDPKVIYPCGPPIQDIEIIINDEFTSQGSVPAGEILNVVTVIASGLYPVEAEDYITSLGKVLNAELIAAQRDDIQTFITFTSGAVTDTLVVHSQPPEEIQTFVTFNQVLILQQLIIQEQPPDEIQTNVIFTSGSVTDVLVKYVHPGTLEVMSTISGIVTDATLTQEP